MNKARLSYPTRLLSLVLLTSVFYLLINFPAFAKKTGALLAGPPVDREAIGLLPRVLSDDFVAPSELDLPDNHLIIPSIGVKVPLWIDVPAENQTILTALQGGVAHFLGTAHPGEIGNVFVAGHSSDYFWNKGRYKTVFSLLDRLKIGDEFMIAYQGRVYRYRVFKKSVVRPSDLSPLAPTEKSVVSLMTCTPLGTRLNRLLVLADQISPDPAQNRAFLGQPIGIGRLPAPR